MTMNILFSSFTSKAIVTYTHKKGKRKCNTIIYIFIHTCVQNKNLYRWLKVRANQLKTEIRCYRNLISNESFLQHSMDLKNICMFTNGHIY